MKDLALILILFTLACSEKADHASKRNPEGSSQAVEATPDQTVDETADSQTESGLLDRDLRALAEFSLLEEMEADLEEENSASGDMGEADIDGSLKERCELLKAKYDADKDGKINRDEWLKIKADIKARIKERREKFKDEYRDGHDGELTEEERAELKAKLKERFTFLQELWKNLKPEEGEDKKAEIAKHKEHMLGVCERAREKANALGEEAENRILLQMLLKKCETSPPDENVTVQVDKPKPESQQDPLDE